MVKRLCIVYEYIKNKDVTCVITYTNSGKNFLDIEFLNFFGCYT